MYNSNSYSSNLVAKGNYYCFQRRAIFPINTYKLWKIETGIVRTLTWLENGSTITLGLWGQGDLVGQALSKIDFYTIECLTAVEAIGFAWNDGDRLTNNLLNQIQQFEELSIIRSSKKLDIVLIKFLSWLAKKFGRQIEIGYLIDFKLTHQDLAEILGVTRVSVTRSLKQLEEQGIIERLSLSRILVREEEVWYYEI